MGEIDAKHRAEMGAGYIIPKSKSRAGYLSIQLKPFDKIKPVLSSRYLVKGWLDRGAFSVVYGESNVGKTFFALDLAMQVAAGKDWHGNKVKDWQSCPGPVVYVAGEGGAGINNRIEAMRRNNPAVAKHIEDNTEFLLLFTTLDLCTSEDAQHLVEAMSEADGAKPSLIVIDTLARSMGNGDENTAKDIISLPRRADTSVYSPCLSRPSRLVTTGSLARSSQKVMPSGLASKPSCSTGMSFFSAMKACISASGR
jgi:hypothetical protein